MLLVRLIKIGQQIAFILNVFPKKIRLIRVTISTMYGLTMYFTLAKQTRFVVMHSNIQTTSKSHYDYDNTMSFNLLS